jgi:hypothetical protein
MHRDEINSKGTETTQRKEGQQRFSEKKEQMRAQDKGDVNKAESLTSDWYQATLHSGTT